MESLLFPKMHEMRTIDHPLPKKKQTSCAAIQLLNQNVQIEERLILFSITLFVTRP